MKRPFYILAIFLLIVSCSDLYPKGDTNNKRSSNESSSSDTNAGHLSPEDVASTELSFSPLASDSDYCSVIVGDSVELKDKQGKVLYTAKSGDNLLVNGQQNLRDDEVEVFLQAHGVYRMAVINKGETSGNTFSCDSRSLKDYFIAVLEDIELFADKELKNMICKVGAGTVFEESLWGIGSVSRENHRDLHIINFQQGICGDTKLLYYSSPKNSGPYLVEFARDKRE